jgi:TPR repeat protein
MVGGNLLSWRWKIVYLFLSLSAAALALEFASRAVFGLDFQSRSAAAASRPPWSGAAPTFVPLAALALGLLTCETRKARNAGRLLAGLVAAALIIVIVMARPQLLHFSALREMTCYRFDGGKVQYDDARRGVDCVTLTPQIVEALARSEAGGKPVRVSLDDIEKRQNAPYWFDRAGDGKMTLYDGPGRDPNSGALFQQAAEADMREWRRQQIDAKELAECARKPLRQLSDPVRMKKFSANGSPLTWFVRRPDGVWEFFGNCGVDPTTGQKLAPFDRAAADEWLRSEDYARRAKDEQARAAKEEEERKAAASTAEDAAATSAAAACDRLAANPMDRMKSAEASGVSYEQLKANAVAAARACETASEKFPDAPRFKYQRARALQHDNAAAATALYNELVQADYPAAFDNLGWLYVDGRSGQRNLETAAKYFRRGAQLNDPDAMNSLAYAILEGWTRPLSAREKPIQLLREAANAGHPGARDTLHQLKQRPGNSAEFDPGAELDGLLRALFGGSTR